MTREEASFILANIDRRVCDDELNEALDMAIKALEQEPCEDAIDRKYLTGLMFTEADLSDAHTCYESIRKIVEEMPSVTPIRPKGHWGDDCGNLKCPYCETVVSDVKVFSPLTKYTNACWFCPICGADMREPQESEE